MNRGMAAGCGVDGEHRAVGPVEHSVCDASQLESIQSCSTVCPHHDEGGPDFIGSLQDDLFRNPGEQFVFSCDLMVVRNTNHAA